MALFGSAFIDGFRCRAAESEQRANPAESDFRNPLRKSESKAEAAQDVLYKI